MAQRSESRWVEMVVRAEAWKSSGDGELDVGRVGVQRLADKETVAFENHESKPFQLCGKQQGMRESDRIGYLSQVTSSQMQVG